MCVQASGGDAGDGSVSANSCQAGSGQTEGGLLEAAKAVASSRRRESLNAQPIQACAGCTKAAQKLAKSWPRHAHGRPWPRPRLATGRARGASHQLCLVRVAISCILRRLVRANKLLKKFLGSFCRAHTHVRSCAFRRARARVCVCVCVCVFARARVCVCVCVRV
jgi:hypothetical protein